jgi:TRAP transporter TAXI family solute receptor
MRKFLFGVLVVMLLVAVIMTGCSQTGQEKAVDKTIVFSGGSVSGTSNISASAFAGVAKEYLGIDSTVIIHIPQTVPTTIHDGVSDIGVSPEPVNTNAYEGIGTYAGKTPLKDLRLLTNMDAMSADIMIPVNVNMTSFKDLVGKRVAVGKSGSLGALFFEDICAALGIKKESINILYVGQDDASSAMPLGKTDAAFAMEPARHPTFEQLDMTFPVKLYQWTDEELKAIIKAMPYLFVQTVPKSYHGPGDKYTGPFLVQGVLTTTRMDEDFIYKLMKNWVGHPEFMRYYRDALKEVIESGDLKSFTEGITYGLPYHAGSVKLFKELGWKLPASRIPTEAK